MCKKTRLFFLLMTVMLPFSSSAREVTVSSPNGQLVITVSDANNSATYSVALNGHEVLLPSALGFKTNMGDFSKGLTITGSKTATAEEEYEMRQAKQSKISYRANTLLVDFENSQRLRMQVEFFVKNNDVAFRYLIPQQKDERPKCVIITEETTAFCLPNGTTSFICPQIDPMKGWERTKPSYEEEYEADAPLNKKSRYGQGYTFPCLFKTPLSSSEPDTSVRKTKAAGEDFYWILISETGVSSQYCGSHLSDYLPPKGGQEGGFRIAYPQQGENNGFGSTSASIALPGATPWRTITVGETLKPIVETTIPYDVVKPLYEPSQTYKGGRYTWSWLIWQDNSINYQDQVAFIDLAAEMGYEYCLVDNWWDQNIGRERIAELSRYAQGKGVSLLLWYNSNGHWNDAPQTPRDCMSTAMARDREMAWMKSIGVKGIKVDFFAGDKQETMQLYEDILYDANRYGLQVVFHGCTIPRGWERMYPNYVASEAVLASENVYFSEHAARQEPFELTLHPFCRNAVGTMDWGGVIMNKHMSRNNRERHQRKTTNGFEIATAFTNQTAVQCVAMQPNNLTELSQTELDFLRQLPTTWDETRFIDGYPGRYVVLARRHGEQWYVAGLNAQKEPLRLTLDLKDFNVKKKIGDSVSKKSKETTVTLSDLKADKKGNVKIEIQPNGGIVLF